MMSKKWITVKLPSDMPFVAEWLLDGLANSAHKGVQTSTLQIATFMADAMKIQDGATPDSDVSQAELGKLADRITEREDQVVDFESTRDDAAEKLYQIAGKKWVPYTKGPSATPRSKTATNEFFKKRFAA